MCRQQLEEMAAKLKFASVHQFAEEVLRSNSAERLTWLRLYYTSLNHPDLANTVINHFPKPDSALTSSSSNSTSRTLQKDVQNPKRRSKYPQKYLEPQNKLEIQENNVPLHQKKPKVAPNYVTEPMIEPKKDGSEPLKKQTNPRKNVLHVVSDVPSPESEEQEETVYSARGHKRTKRGSVSSSGASRAGGGLGVDRAGNSGQGPGEAAAFLIHKGRDTPSSLDLSHGWSTTLSKPTAQGMEQEQKLFSITSETFKEKKENAQDLPPKQQAPSTSSHRSLLTDLLGDTSILDDLLKPKFRGPQQSSSPKTSFTLSSASASTCPPTTSSSRITVNTDPGVKYSLSSSNSQTPPPPTHQASSKGSRKDFWDILNEGNEESINRLTDLAEVQRVCINTNFAARTRSVEEESKSLWKTNEKFLWKK